MRYYTVIIVLFTVFWKVYSTSISDCRAEFLNYRDCVKGIDNDFHSFENVCEIVNSDKCKKFFEDPITIHEACNTELRMKNVLENIKRYYDNGVNYYCQKDEKENLCPGAEQAIMILEKYQNNDISDSIQILKNSCVSKACTNASINFIDYILTDSRDFNEFFIKRNETVPYTDNENNVFKETLSYLKSEQCGKSPNSGAELFNVFDLTTLLIIVLINIYLQYN
ncbi:hypothetical protein PIROE2DRAFT_56996 [Piromyces sp. E2]|nr:hypothetical protein PIROE2DRAFT_56996 [Piromyces sp. E2]|eukprot:OUM70123.1 hypothetical protein PIROE2DRAFT_56996 [Piromyces sp. E2]